MVTLSMPTKVLSGKGVIEQIGELVKDYGERIFVVYDAKTAKETEYFARVKNLLEKNSFGVLLYNCSSSVGTSSFANSRIINEGAEQAKYSRCNVIIGFGDTATLYTAKAIAYLMSKKGKIEDYLYEKSFSIDKADNRQEISYIELPITYSLIPGLTKFFYVLDSYSNNNKAIKVKGPCANLVIIDPMLMPVISSDSSGYLGIYILSLAIESLLSKQVNILGISFALNTIDTIFKHITYLAKEPSNLQARKYISNAAILSSLAVSNSTLGSCFAISLAISSIYNIKQNIASTVLLPYIMEFNATSSANNYVSMYNTLGHSRGDMTIVEAAVKMVESVRGLIEELGLVNKLSDLKIDKSNFLKIAKLALSYNFMHFVPRSLEESDITNILESAY